MEKQKGLHPWTWLGIAASLVWCLVILRYQSELLFVVLGTLLVLCFSPTLVQRLEMVGIRHAVSTMRGFLYVGFLGSFAYLVRNFPDFEGSELGAAALSVKPFDRARGRIDIATDLDIVNLLDFRGTCVCDVAVCAFDDL